MIRHLALSALLAAAPALAAEGTPPSCTDARFVKRIAGQYNTAETFRTHHKIKRIDAIAEIGLGAPKPGLLAPVPKNTTIKSRYCQADLVLDDGEKDHLYWRIDAIDQGGELSTNYDHCSTRHDTFKDKCIDYQRRQ